MVLGVSRVGPSERDKDSNVKEEEVLLPPADESAFEWDENEQRDNPDYDDESPYHLSDSENDGEPSETNEPNVWS